MNVAVDLEDLLAAQDWLNSADVAMVDARAYIHRSSGVIRWQGEGVDEELLPEDIEDATLYIAVPRQSDLGLGRPLALRFAQEHLPLSLDTVYGYFRQRGAYARFKALLEQAGQLEAWHQYEQRAKEEALSQWCAENGFVAARGSHAADQPK